MKRATVTVCILAAAAVMMFSGCQTENNDPDKAGPETGVSADADKGSENAGSSENTIPQADQEANDDPVIEETDWSEYFGGMNGSAVLYDPAENRYQIYNMEEAQTRRSPCSTFKIISSAIGLEEGIIPSDDAVRPWSGEVFWNENWNRDIGFADAFKTSCVWYFRQVIDEIGTERMQSGLSELKYGNCDISDWEGSLNTNSGNPALTGFWIESSLLISPKEQTEVMERIFGEDSQYSQETQERLKEVMLVEDQDRERLSIYGKTGQGATAEATVDAWFTGFADVEGRRLYYCVHLGETEGADISSVRAREIAVSLLQDEVSPS